MSTYDKITLFKHLSHLDNADLESIKDGPDAEYIRQYLGYGDYSSITKFEIDEVEVVYEDIDYIMDYGTRCQFPTEKTKYFDSIPLLTDDIIRATIDVSITCGTTKMTGYIWLDENLSIMDIDEDALDIAIENNLDPFEVKYHIKKFEKEKLTNIL